jgi:hypothetical protein
LHVVAAQHAPSGHAPVPEQSSEHTCPPHVTFFEHEPVSAHWMSHVPA